MNKFDFNMFDKGTKVLEHLLESARAEQPNETRWFKYNELKSEFDSLITFGLKTAQEDENYVFDYYMRQSHHVLVPNHIPMNNDKVIYLPVFSVQPFQRKRPFILYRETCFHFPDPVWYCNKCEISQANSGQLTDYGSFGESLPSYGGLSSVFENGFKKNDCMLLPSFTNVATSYTNALEPKINTPTTLTQNENYTLFGNHSGIQKDFHLFERKGKTSIKMSTQNETNALCKFCLRTEHCNATVTHTFRNEDGIIICPKYIKMLLLKHKKM